MTYLTNSVCWYHDGDVKIVWPMIVSSIHVYESPCTFFFVKTCLHLERAANLDRTGLFGGLKVSGVCFTIGFLVF